MISVVLILISEINGFVDIAIDMYGINAWLYLVTGTLGSLLVFILAGMFAARSRGHHLLLPIGENSQTIYEIHPVFFFLIPLSLYVAGWSVTDIGSSFNLFWPVRLIIAVAFSLPFALKVVPRSRILSIIFTGRYEKKDGT